MFTAIANSPLGHILKNHHFDVRSKTYPLRGQRALLSMLSGVCIVIVIDMTLASAHDNLHEWLLSAHHTALSSCPALLLEAGDALALPFGAVPLVVGLQSSDSKVDVATPRRKVASSTRACP